MPLAIIFRQSYPDTPVESLRTWAAQQNIISVENVEKMNDRMMVIPFLSEQVIPGIDHVLEADFELFLIDHLPAVGFSDG